MCHFLQKNGDFWKLGFGSKKRQKNALIAPLAKRWLKKGRVPRALFLLRRNGGVGGEQSGDEKSGLNLRKNRVFLDTPPPILGVDIDPGGGGRPGKTRLGYENWT